MTLNGVLEKTIAVLKPFAPSVAVEANSKILNDLHLDSLSLIHLSLALEKEFSQTLFVPELLLGSPDPFQITVEDVAKFIQSKLATKVA